MTKEVKSAIGGLFAAVVGVTTTVIVSFLGWSALQIGSLNHDVSVIQVQQLEHEQTGHLVREMRDTLIRVEEGQKNIAKEVMILRNHAKEHATRSH